MIYRIITRSKALVSGISFDQCQAFEPGPQAKLPESLEFRILRVWWKAALAENDFEVLGLEQIKANIEM